MRDDNMRGRGDQAAVAAVIFLLFAGLAAIYDSKITRLKAALFGREGLIIVNTPAVFSRKRLVIDRLSQTA
jgi:phosphoglycerol transferase MdoB-like AlkP superfamily enzyme